jgi:hypothetical protein
MSASTLARIKLGLSLPRLRYDAAEISDPHPTDMARDIDIISGILEDLQVLQFNCLGDVSPEINRFRDPAPMATVQDLAFETCWSKFFLIPGSESLIRSKTISLHSLFESCILLA